MTTVTDITKGLATLLSGLGAPVVFDESGEREYILLEGPSLSKEEEGNSPDNHVTIYTYTITIHAEEPVDAFGSAGSLPTWKERALDLISNVWPALHNQTVEYWQLFPQNGDWDEQDYVITCTIRKPEDLRPCR